MKIQRLVVQICVSLDVLVQLSGYQLVQMGRNRIPDWREDVYSIKRVRVQFSSPESSRTYIMRTISYGDVCDV